MKVLDGFTRKNEHRDTMSYGRRNKSTKSEVDGIE